MDIEKFWKSNSTFGNKKPTQKDLTPHSELEAFSLAIECMLHVSACQAFDTDCKDLISIIQDLGA